MRTRTLFATLLAYVLIPAGAYAATLETADSTASDGSCCEPSDIITGPGSKKLIIKGGKAGRLRIYGEVANFASYQTREGVSDPVGFIYMLPAKRNLNSYGIDLNNVASFRFLSLGSRLGVNWTGCRIGNMSLGARMEGDFYCMSGVKSVFRLRFAYFTAAWDFGKWRTLGVLAGQNWHPFAADQPHSFDMNCGAPFNPYSHAPQLKIDYEVLDWMKVGIAALWQSSYCSNGPDGVSSQYIEWSCCPELFLGLDFKYKGFSARTGASFLSIKPRLYTLYQASDDYIWVTDKANFLSGFAFVEYKGDRWSVRAKSVIAQDGEHLSLFGGYGISSVDELGSRTYTPFLTSSSWISGGYGLPIGKSSLLNFTLMGGYIQNLGASHLISTDENYIYYTSDCANLLRAARALPGIEYRFKYLRLGVEYEYTAAQYGRRSSMSTTTGLVTELIHWTDSHRIILLLGVAF